MPPHPAASVAGAAPESGPPPSLVAAAAVARLLAREPALDAVLPRILTLVREAVAADECSLWLWTAGELRAAGGTEGRLDAADVRAALLDAGDGAAGEPGAGGPGSTASTGSTASPASTAPLVVLPLAAGDRTHGALAASLAASLSAPATAEARLLLAAVADQLAAALAHGDQRRTLQTEVDSRARQIAEERRFTDRVIDALPMGLYVIDRQYRIQLWNRKREMGLQGVSRDEAVGRPIFEILHRQPAAMLREEFEDVFRTGEVQHFSMESSSTGELRYYRITKFPMRAADGEVSHVITIGEDVTEWREAQERFAQAEKLAAIGQLAAGVMHEINNPLATIGACAESLALALQDASAAAAPPPPECGEYLSIVESEVHRSKRIVDRLLEFSRPKPLAPEPVDLNAVVEQTLFLLKHHSRFKAFGVHCELADPPPVARGNGEQLVQVLMALLINAMDAMAQPGAIDVRTVGGGDGREVLLEVRDRGHGIPRAQLPKVFEPFYTTKAPGRGTGLGLSICYGIVAEHGGRMEVESAVGEGTVVRVRLPTAGS